LAASPIERDVFEESAPAGIFNVSLPSADRIDPPAGPIVADDGMSAGSGAIRVMTGSPDPASVDES
jgi:hypothetical protein